MAFNNRVLPAQRADFYKKTVDAMLRPDYTLDMLVVADIEERVGGSLPMNRDMLQYLAFHVHSQNVEISNKITERSFNQSHRNDNNFDEETLYKILTKEPAYLPYIQELITQTRQRNTLLEERNGDYRFIHLSFQEFLAGRYLAQNFNIEEIAVFFEEGNVLDPWWREPALLMVGFLDITAPTLARRLLLRLARTSQDILSCHISPENEVASVELAAAALLECQNQSDDLRALIKRRLEFLLTQNEIVDTKQIVRSNAADMLDSLGYIPKDLYKFVHVTDIQPSKQYFGLYPVTNSQYERFLRAENFLNKDLWANLPRFDNEGRQLDTNWGNEGWEWISNKVQSDIEKSISKSVLYPRYWTDFRLGHFRSNSPVVGVSYWEANAYCRWLLANWDELESVPKPRLVRLPTEKEWVIAAGGAQNKRYAWDIDNPTTDVELLTQLSNTAECEIGRTTPVWMYKNGKSYPFGLSDMSGNTWEWQANYYDNDFEEIGLRGGAWTDNQVSARISYRINALPEVDSTDIGFRIIYIENDD